MAAQLDSLTVTGDIMCRTISVQTASITNSMVTAGAAIEATKTRRRYYLNYTQLVGTAVVAETRGLGIIRVATGTLVAVEAAVIGAVATGGDRTVNVDVQKGNQSTAFATMLSATILFNSSSTLRAVSSGTLSVTSLADNDQLQVVVTVAGAAGAQAQGLLVTVTVDEDPI
jgi:hypothetical protein